MLLIASGQLDLDDGTNRLSVDTPESLVLVEPNTSADLQKTPGGIEQCFHSIFLTFSAALLSDFHCSHPPFQSTPSLRAPFRSISSVGDLAATLKQVLESIQDSSISDERLRYRLLDLLLALAELGHRFGRVDPANISRRLRTLIGEDPVLRWTAETAGKELAMSAATLRRRLSSESVRFEDLLIDVRMHHAMMLLQTTAWGITHVAEASGYKSRARFSERFQERFGYPPSAIR